MNVDTLEGMAAAAHDRGSCRVIVSTLRDALDAER